MVEYQIKVVEGDLAGAEEVFKEGVEKGVIGREGRGRLARFLEGRG